MAPRTARSPEGAHAGGPRPGRPRRWRRRRLGRGDLEHHAHAAGGGETVVARLEGTPSGSNQTVSFLVADGRVTPMDGLARRLLAGTAGAGSPAMRTTMAGGMRMDMP